MACKGQGAAYQKIGRGLFKKARAYAQARANATGKAYVVTGMGHAFTQAGNAALLKETGGIAFVCRKDRKRARKRRR